MWSHRYALATILQPFTSALGRSPNRSTKIIKNHPETKSGWLKDVNVRQLPLGNP